MDLTTLERKPQTMAKTHLTPAVRFKQEARRKKLSFDRVRYYYEEIKEAERAKREHPEPSSADGLDFVQSPLPRLLGFLAAWLLLFLSASVRPGGRLYLYPTL